MPRHSLALAFAACALRSEEHTSELQSRSDLVCRLLLEKKKHKTNLPNLSPHWGLLLVFAYIAVLSHLLLDYTNNYGVRPFWTFLEMWYSWDIDFIVEPA